MRGENSQNGGFLYHGCNTAFGFQYDSGVRNRLLCRDVELFELSIQVGPFDPELLRGGPDAAAVLLDDRGDVVALESLSRLAQRLVGADRRFRRIQADVG